MSTTQKIWSGIAVVSVLLTAVVKFHNGEAPNMTEIMLAISTFAAAFGFQKPSA